MSLGLFKVSYIVLGAFACVSFISLNIYSNEVSSPDEKFIVTSKNAKQRDTDVILAATADLKYPDKKNLSKKRSDITSSIVVIPKALDDRNHSIYPIITVEGKIQRRMESERNKITQLTARVNSDMSPESNGSKKEYSTIEEFLKFISPRAFSICFMSCKNRDDAHDIVQSSMCKLVEKYRNNAQSQWKPLFYTILRNKLNDFHRKRLLLGRFFVEVDNDLEQIDNQNHTSQSMVNNFSANNPDILMDREKRISLLMSSIAALPNRQQQAFIFRYLEGYSTNQTALAMNCSEGSVKTHLSRANQKLKFLLKDIYYD